MGLAVQVAACAAGDSMQHVCDSAMAQYYRVSNWASLRSGDCSCIENRVHGTKAPSQQTILTPIFANPCTNQACSVLAGSLAGASLFTQAACLEAPLGAGSALVLVLCGVCSVHYHIAVFTLGERRFFLACSVVVPRQDC